jgi:lysophospholipase
LLALVKGEPRFSAAMATAPMLGLKAASGALRPITKALAKRMVRTGRGRDYIGNRPVDPFAAAFAVNELTHDRARFERMQSLIAAWPDLALGQVTWSWVDSALTAMAWLRQAPEVERLAIPVVLLAAEKELLVDNAAIAAFAHRLPDGHFQRLERSRHELLMETDDIRAETWRIFDSLAARVTTGR